LKVSLSKHYQSLPFIATSSVQWKEQCSVIQETLYVLPANRAGFGTGNEQEEKSGVAEVGDSTENGE
jgi:hypothetical protein